MGLLTTIQPNDFPTLRPDGDWTGFRKTLAPAAEESSTIFLATNAVLWGLMECQVAGYWRILDPTERLPEFVGIYNAKLINLSASIGRDPISDEENDFRRRMINDFVNSFWRGIRFALHHLPEYLETPEDGLLQFRECGIIKMAEMWIDGYGTHHNSKTL